MINLTPKRELKVLNTVERTDSNLQMIQDIKSIHRFKLNMDAVGYYFYDGIKSTLDPKDSSTSKLFKVFNMPLLPEANRNKKFIYTYKQMIEKHISYGMIFTKKIDGVEYAISWDDIIVIREDTNMYMIISNIDSANINANSINALIIPFATSYKKSIPSEDKFPENGFVFDSEGRAIFNKYNYKDASMVITIESEDFDYYEYEFTSMSQGIIATLDDKGSVFQNSIIVYKDGNIVTDNTKYIEYVGNNSYKILDPELSEDLLLLRVYYFNKAMISTNYTNMLSEDAFSELASMKMSESLDDKYAKIFELLNLDSDKPLSENIQERLNKVIKYKKSIIEEHLDVNRDVLYVSHAKGKDLKRNEDSYDISTLGLELWQKEGYVQNVFYPLIFSNNKLIRDIDTININNRYRNYCLNTRKIGIEDNIELYYFGQVPREITQTIVVSNGDRLVDVNMDNYTIFEKNPTPVDYPEIADREDACFEYKVKYTYTTNGETSIIEFEDSKYYDTELLLVSNKQYHIYSSISENGENVCINLPEEFRYAQNEDQYMVFIDGKKISNDYLIFNFPDATNPFPFVSIYSKIIFKDAQKIDVIYVPFELKEYRYDSINRNGIVRVDNDILPCPINTENMMVFLNGSKINNNNIDIISDNVFKINTEDICSTMNLSIIIPSINPAIEILDENDDWNEFIDTLSLEDLYIFSDVLLDNNEESIYDNETYHKAILLEIFRDFYSYKYDGEPFLYNGNDEILEDAEQDVDMNYILNVANARVKNSVNFDHLDEEGGV